MSSETRRQLNRDGIASAAALCLAGLYWVGAENIPRSSLIGNGIGADAIPVSLAVALAIFSSILLIRTLILRFRLDAAEAPTDEERQERREIWRRHARAAGMVAIGLVFLLILEPVGYVLSTIALAFATAVYNGQSVNVRVVAFAVGLAVLFYGLFAGVLHIPLPTGVFGGLLGH